MAGLKYAGLIITLVILAFILSACSSSSPQSQPSQPGNNAAPAAANRVKFSDSPLFKSAYLISGDSLSPDAQAAIAGFTINKTSLPDGTTQIDLITSEASYKNQTIVLKQGEQLYFIEKFMGDDKAGKEYNLGDDSAVVVDSDGYIVQ